MADDRSWPWTRGCRQPCGQSAISHDLLASLHAPSDGRADAPAHGGSDGGEEGAGT